MKHMKSVLDLVEKALAPKPLAIELAEPHYVCRACGRDIEPSELHTTSDGTLEHESEGEYSNGSWHQLYCGPCEEVDPEEAEEAEGKR